MNIKLTIDRFEGELALLKTSEGGTITWPKNKLPDNAREGMVINFYLSTDEGEEKNQKNLAKKILNEILKTKG